MLRLCEAQQGATSLEWCGGTGHAQDLNICSMQGLATCNEQGDVLALHLGDKGLSGVPIPSEFGDIESLQKLEMEDNELAGPVPTQLGRLGSLTHLTATNAGLVGALPTQLGTMHELKELRLSGNSLTGSVPWYFLPASMRFLSLSYNNDLSGTLPLAFVERISERSTYGGARPGEGPREYAGLELHGRTTRTRMPPPPNPPPPSPLFARRYGYAGRRLGEEVHPDSPEYEAVRASYEWRAWSRRENVPRRRLAETELEVLPVGGDYFPHLSEIIMTGTKLSGTLPTQIGTISGLKELNFKDVRSLDGAIPTELAQLTKLARLYLDGTKMGGAPTHIPNELNDNNLHGKTSMWCFPFRREPYRPPSLEFPIIEAENWDIQCF